MAIQDDDVHALLKYPLQPSKDITKIGKETQIDPAGWYNTLANNGSTLSASQDTTAFEQHTLYVRIPAGGKDLLMNQLESSHVDVHVLSTPQPSLLFTMLLRFAPLLLLLGLLLVFFVLRNRRNSPGFMDDRVSQIGKSRARRFDRLPEGVSPPPTQSHNAKPLSGIRGSSTAASKSGAAPIANIPSVTFADVAGIDEVKSELVEMVQFLRQPEKFSRLGAHIPRGALLVGSPGTGKTLLAKAVAGEAHVPFFSISASEFVEMFVGVGASRVRDLFQQARHVAPCVIFIDEIDAVGRKRSVRATGNDERDQTLNQLLVELDGFDARQAVIVMAATNRVDILDKALLRPGRFDRRITVSAPDRVGREAILRVHSRQTPLAMDVSLERLARLTTGMTGADLANLVNEAALSAARRDLMAVTHECFEEALARIQLGALRPLVMSEDERRIIAVHEGGHALVAHYLPEADRVNRVTILPRGQSLGVTQFSAEMDRYNYSRETLMARIAVGLGGRVAEELTFGVERVTTGAENDLQVVTDLARKMVTRWGMSERIGVMFADYRPEESYELNLRQIDPDAVPAQARTLVADAQGNLHLHGVARPIPGRYYAQTMPSRSISGVTMNSLVDAEVQRILQDGHAMAHAILTEHSDMLTTLAAALIEHEQLDRDQFEAVVAQA
ncbi:hypothetical protein KDAU_05590 [Dictyobacter aurantiacus]|uniref:ATP-dependent zinc metalloprotease FtsH n=1 Tax=Dictyobacter aurantiacus TaxID=1936993 RepID=A0A401Z8N7_9CHLR|nr:ATP-dependent zinc metalloprotease FtsH [Dictyobacter aurantiacus]GCE03230.1 hypothetical protein KDAU_05590 [Dictyobacter aurantiacus]